MMRIPTIQKVGSAWERLRHSLFGADRSHTRKSQSRRLMIDQLEERTLLSVSPTPLHVQETQVNTTVTGVNLGANADRCSAMDDAGDFVVVWTGNDADGVGVYMRAYNSDGTARTAEKLVNTYTLGAQYQAAVAMDGDGDFVVTWTSASQEGADDSSGIYAQRFNSMGERIGSEIHVNTNTVNMQSSPSIAIDGFGDFVIVWATTGQTFSYNNDVRGQVFDRDGNRLGSEFRVNSQNVAGAQGSEIGPSVAMSDFSTGTFAVAWATATGQKNGVATNSVALARVFTWDHNGATAMSINGRTTEFQVDTDTSTFITDTEHVESDRKAPLWAARNVQVAMDPSGDFIVAWESYHDNDIITPIPPQTTPPDKADSYGIYYRVFNANGTPQTAVECQANQVVTSCPAKDDWPYTMDQMARWDKDQLNASVSMDADGDFTITWDGNGSNASSPMSPPSSYYGTDPQGVWVRRFYSTSDGYTETPAICTQSRVNSSVTGAQRLSTVTENRSGDFLVTWSDGFGNIFYQIYRESTDTAGPVLTGFLLPDGSAMNSNSQVTQAIQAVVITFDEPMLASSVTNPANYWLLVDGVKVQNGVSQVYYGLDIANSLGSQYGLNVPQLGKYQAVLIIDSNGKADGTQALVAGQYQIAVTNAIRDAAGNVLNSTGPGPDGGLSSGLINVVLPTGQETKVASGTVPDGVSYGKYTYASTADPVAADAQGDYVVAWTDTTPGHEGVWVKMYTQTSTLNPAPTGRTTEVTEYPAVNPATGAAWVNNEIQVSAVTSASDISVARADAGDFVVTWTAWTDAASTYDIYARRYSATGQPLGAAFRVNATIANVQMNSAVAVDTQGDFVITWQSENQDGSGWGVYAQVYNALGEIVGGTDEIQAIDFTGGFTGTFVLRWNDDNNSFTPDKVTAPITFNGNASASLTSIENALAAIGAHVKAVANGLSEVLLEFVDSSGSANQQPLWISPTDIVQSGGTADATVTMKTITDGVFGEFRVNDTTTGDQIAPDVAMDNAGDFVVTWTSYGQAGDSVGESNVYAKRYAASGFTWYPQDISSSSSSLAFTGDLPNSSIQPNMTTVDSPDNHVVAAGTGFDAVVQVIADDYGATSVGSGSLLAGTNWILTAGHVAWAESIQAPLLASQLTVAFDLAGGRVYVPVTQVIVNPGFAGADNFLFGNDLALLKLAYVPVGVQGLPIYTGSDEIGKTFDLYGYGTYGTGGVGAVFDVDYQKRHGQNIFDATGALLGYTDGQLISDFDDGSAKNDALGNLYNLHNTDSALVAAYQEAMAAPGDSGGPLLINGKIAAIVSGSGLEDVGSAYTQIGVWCRISTFASWIESVTNCQGQAEFLVNQNDIVATAGYDASGNPIFYALDNQSDNQGQSSVAMDAAGDFVVTWTSHNHDGAGNGYGNSVNGENGIFARRYNATALATSDVFQVNQNSAGNQQNSKVAMNDAGDFVVTWQSSSGPDLITGNESFDIYARRYARTSLVNYAQNAAGFPLLWSGHNSLYSTDPLNITAIKLTSTGATASYAAGDLLFNNGAIGAEVLVNTTTSGDQAFPGVAVDAAGDAVIVWSGSGQQAGQEDGQGIFYQRFTMPKDAGNPQVAEAFNVVKTNGTTTSSFLPDATVLAAGPTQFLITFNEPLSIQNGSSGANSILNLANWQLTRNGKSLPNAVAKVQYGFNEAYVLGLSSTRDNKYEAVITFDSDTTSSGSQALLAGAYDLTILSAVQDLFGNGLDGAYAGAAGNFVRSFTVIGDTSVIDSPIGNITAPGNPTGSTDLNTNTYHTGLDGVTPEVAMDGDGDYVVVWQSSRYGDGGDIAFQRYNRFGQSQGVEGTANPHTKTTSDTGLAVYAGNGVQSECAVAMDTYGDFVIVWAGDGTIPGTINSTADTTGIFAQIFDKNGKAVGERIAVNQSLPGIQQLPSVAMDASGNFVVTWTTSDDETDRSGLNVYGRRFSIQGLALSDEFRVNTTAAGAQEDADIAMDSAGNFVVAWQSFGQDGSDWGVYAQRYSKTGAKLGGEFQVNYYATDKQQSPSVAMNANGAFVIAYASFNQDGSGYGVYARRYGASGVALDASEFPVSTTTVNWQVDPEVGIATNGNFVVTWSSFGQDNTKAANPTNDYGIYARMFNANGTEMTSKAGNTYGEFRINAATVGDQTVPCVAMSPAGDTFIVAWASAVTYVGDQPSGGMPIMKTDMEVFSRLVDPVIGSGPQIGSVVVAPADGLITWNAVDPDGVTIGSITIDGTVVSKIYGPMGATSGVNFAAVFGKLATGSHSFTITATDKLGNSSTYDGNFIVAANAGPTIGNVAVAAASGLMTWNAVDADGVASSTVKIDGVTVSKIYGPMTAASGVNFAAVFGTLATGTHQYVITATDKAGNSSTLTANFDVAAPTPGNSAPTISSVVVAQASGMMTWNVVDPDGVASSTVTVDGLTVSKLYGPMTAASGVNYAGVFGTLATGEHSYTITATDRLGNAATSAGKFTVETTTNPGPTISSVAVSQANGIITWNALDADGIASSTVTIDNKAASKIYGPMTAASGSNFAGTLGTLAAGNHAYVITATDRQGNVSNLTGNFTVTTIANPGPTIGSVALSLSSGVITWNTIDTDGVRAASLTIDGANVSKLYGPMSASSGVNFAGVFGTLTSGSHSYVITATDTLGNSSTYNGQFSVAGSSGGSVYSVAARGAVMSAAATKIASSAKVDWLCDLPALSPASKDASSEAEDAVDAVMASY